MDMKETQQKLYLAGLGPAEGEKLPLSARGQRLFLLKKQELLTTQNGDILKTINQYTSPSKSKVKL